MKRMLFNATQPEELRVAIVDGQKLIDLDIETAGKESRKSNIYKAVVTRIEPSLEACFVDYGGTRHGFLPFKEVAPQYFQPGTSSRSGIKEALKEGQELLVQVEKDERGNKGAALTTYISLAGRYIVLMPNNPHGGGVSRRIEGEERNELRDVIAQLEVPTGMSLIARTAGIGRSLEELQWDLNYLKQLWDAIESAAKEEKAPSLIYLESSLVVRAIRDYFNPDIGEILIDTDDIYEQAHAFMSIVMPDNVGRIKRYRDDVPLFSRFQIEHQIESAHAREVRLPSGGAIIIDHTEALTAIDINSARATKGADIETTALNTNLEAADEIARQIRLRDLGGLIVIDFIDMESAKNQRMVEERLREALRYDRARVQTSKISRFGLLELSRQRLAPSLEESSYIPCPRCHGIGHIRSIESSALNILRIIQEEAMKDNSAAIHAQVPVDVATFLLNEKRGDIHRIESRLKVHITVIPNPHLETPHYSITRLRLDDITPEHLQASYKLVEKPEEEKPASAAAQEAKAQRPQAAVKSITPTQPAPVRAETKTAKPSLFGKLFGWLFGSAETPRPAALDKARAKSERRERGERREGQENQPGRQRNKGRRERPETGERPENAKPQEPRTERVPRQEAKPALETNKPEVAANNANEEGNAREGRKRGRRGGRRERERRENQIAASGTAGELAESTIESATNVASPEKPASAPPLQNASAESSPAPTEPPAASVIPESIVETESAPPTTDTVAALAPATEAEAQPTPAPTAVVADLATLLDAAGLQLVETDPSKMAAPPAAAAEAGNTPKIPRRRPRPREIYTAEEEPLVMVETQTQQK